MNTVYKWGIVTVVILLALYGLGPTLADYFSDGQLDRNVVSAEREQTLKDQGQEVTPREDGGFAQWIMKQGTPLTLGLDLQGGLLLQYQVLVDKAMQEKLDRMKDDFKARVKDQHPDVGVEVNHEEGDYFIRATFDFSDTTIEEDGETRQKNMGDVLTQDDMMSYFPNLDRIDEGGNTVRLQMSDEYIDETKKFVVEQAIETIRERVNSLGVTEPSITRRGQSDIVVQLPGLGEDDRQRAKELIGQTAQLVFRLVDDEGTNQFFNQFRSDLPQDFVLRQAGNFRTITYQKKDPLKTFFEDRTDEDHIIGYEYMPVYKDRENKIIDKEQSYWKSYYLFEEVQVTGDRVQSARVSVDQQTQKPVVSLTFNRKGAEQFEKLTREHVDERFAIMLDDEVQSAPVINEPIPGGRAQITLGSLRSYSELQQEAQDLVIVLRHGALPAPIELQYQTAVGPTLGQESITSSSWALLVGTLLIILFMLIYYRGSGVVSVLALLFNFLFILAGLAGLGATLTLPGIAGIILTVGMAVDANVIIFERIREEQRAGSNAIDSVNTGFDKAFSAVADANVTTGIAALVLLQYGTGPIRGFAVTLLIGIVATLFTAVFMSRLIFDLWLEWRSEQQDLSI